MKKIRIRLKAYDHQLLDLSTSDLVNLARKTGAKVVGPQEVTKNILGY